MTNMTTETSALSLPDWTLQYEKGVPATVEIPDIPLHRILDDSAARFPHNPAIHFLLKYLSFGLEIGSRMNYTEVKEATDRFANALHKLGVRQGDRVALMMPNTPQQILAFFGVLKAGAVIVNINPTYTPREILHLLKDSGAQTIVTLSGLHGRIEEIRGQTDLKHVILTDIVDSLAWLWRKLAARQVRATGMMADVAPAPHIHRFYELIRQAAPTPPAVSYAPDDVVLLQYTGGTTGAPKAAMLTHKNLVSNVHQSRPWFVFAVDGEEKALAAIPFFHVYGMMLAMLIAFKMGAEVIAIPNPRDIDLVLEIITKERISYYPGVPAMYVAINNHPRVHEYDLRSVQGCMSGGTSLPIEVKRRFEELTQGYLAEGYGLSETSPVVSATALRGVVPPPGSIGIPIPNTRIEVVALHPDENGVHAPMPIGEPGELVVYGPQVMKGYWNAPEETRRSLNDRGGLHTGDIGRMDEKGYFYIVDRKKDLIIASGYNIVPREVEEVLFMHPKIVEAVVAGIPDPRRGETVKAYLVLKAGESCTEEEIRTFCKQYLAPYKVPTHVEVRKELPKSLVGKVLRRILVEEEIAKQAGQSKAEERQTAQPAT
jgi:long-chain acyl-CoA synthetase